MRLKWHVQWRNPVRKGVRSGLPARSSTLTTRGEAISMSFGFDWIAPLRRRERLENEPHFLRFRSLRRSNPPQTISASFMSPSPSLRARARSTCAQKGADKLIRRGVEPARTVPILEQCSSFGIRQISLSARQAVTRRAFACHSRSIASISPTHWSAFMVPLAKAAIWSNTASEKPPMLRISGRGLAWVDP